MSAPHGTAPPVRRKKRRRKTPEQNFQMDIKQYLDLALPFPHAWFGASAATGTSKTTGGILKAMGYQAGTPDMLVTYQGQTIWLELKSASGSLTKVQEQCRDDLVTSGCKWALVRTLEDVERALRCFGVPLRASVGTGRESEKAVLLACGAA